MCNEFIIEFVKKNLTAWEVTGKRVLEVGAYDVNGTCRPYIESLSPQQYIGIDIRLGPCVDLICDVEEIEARFGAYSFDILLCTEVLEHVEDWRTAVRNLKAVIRPSGVILLTTRSRGFHLHDYPGDYWRFGVGDMKQIFGDFLDVTVEPDPKDPGVFVKARKPIPNDYRAVDLDSLTVYEVVPGQDGLKERV